MVIHGFQQTVTLADGTVLNGYAGLNETEDDLWVWLDADTDMMTAFQLFSDPSKTIRLRTDLTAEVYQEYEGYTNLALIRQDMGKVSARMKRSNPNA